MGEALLDGQPFRIDPMSVSWDYTIKLSESNTVGGRVVQVLGSNLGDMTVIGNFGIGGWQEQTAFLERMKLIADRQQASTAAPMRFFYPPKGWDFLVYLRAFQQPGANDSVNYANDIPAPPWQLTLFIVEDNSGLHIASAAQAVFIARLAQGIGWKGLSQWNGPVGYQELQQILQGQSIPDYLNDQLAGGLDGK